MKYFWVVSWVFILLSLGSAGIRAEELASDVDRGKKVFWQCRACHYPEKGLAHNNGPSLWAIFGKKAGRQAGFEYSQAFKQAQFVWTPQLMDVWLQDPSKFVPGNLMMNPGISDPQQRADLIRYLQTFKP